MHGVLWRKPSGNKEFSEAVLLEDVLWSHLIELFRFSSFLAVNALVILSHCILEMWERGPLRNVRAGTNSLEAVGGMSKDREVKPQREIH